MTQFVKSTKRNQVGKVISENGNILYVRNAATGQNGTFFANDVIDATQDEYDAQVEQRLHPQPASQPAVKVITNVASAPQKKQVYRWTCLDCGTKYNGYTCPGCGSQEHFHNTDADTDASILAER